MKKTFLKAHEMVREIKREFADVDYRTQFGLNLSYLLNKKEEEEMKIKFEKKGTDFIVELKGTDCYITVFGETVSVDPVVTRGMWAYKGRSRTVVNKLFGRGKGSTFHVAHDSAEQIYNEIGNRKREEKKQQIDAIKNGTTKINVTYHDGEYLSGHSVSGHAARLLKELGLAEDVSMWGTHVNSELIEALGEEFTYSQAVEFARPEMEKKEAAKKAAEAEKAAKFAEARGTGEMVMLRRFVVACNDPKEECDTDIITEYAMPDGTVKVERHHTW